MSRVISYNINPNLNIQEGVHKTYFIIRGKKLSDEEIAIQNVDDISSEKYYFVKKDEQKEVYVYYYPSEFTAPSETGEDKYIIYQYGRCEVNGSFPTDVELHASFVPRDKYCDSLVYYMNLQPPDDNRKYKVNTNKQMGFEIWFTDSTGEKARTPDNFVIFLKLVY